MSVARRGAAARAEQGAAGGAGGDCDAGRSARAKR